MKIEGLHVSAGLLSFLAVTKTCQVHHVAVTPTLDLRRRRQQLLGRKLGIAVDHLLRLPAAQVLEFVAVGSCLPMPTLFGDEVGLWLLVLPALTSSPDG